EADGRHPGGRACRRAGVSLAPGGEPVRAAGAVMHAATYRYVRCTVRRHGPWRTVLEIGSWDVNGSVRRLFAGATYLGVDIVPGPGVDVVADGASFAPEHPPDCVVCTEVLEHTLRAEAIVANAHRMLAPGGVLVLTAAWAGRLPHSAVDGGRLRPREFYSN